MRNELTKLAESVNDPKQKQVGWRQPMIWRVETDNYPAL